MLQDDFLICYIFLITFYLFYVNGGHMCYMVPVGKSEDSVEELILFFQM